MMFSRSDALRAEQAVLARGCSSHVQLIVALLACAACATPERTAPSADLGRGASVASASSQPEWTGFAADVEIAVIRAGKRVASRSRLERVQTSTGEWVTRVTRPLHPVASHPNRLVTTVQLSDDGSISAYGADGAPIPVESFMTPAASSAQLRSRRVSLNAFPQRTTQAPRRQDPNTLLDNLVVTPASAVRMAARLERRMVKGAGQNGALKYTSTGKIEAEVLVDSATGAIIEETTTSQSRRIVHVKHSYTRLGTGVLVRSMSRAEYGPAGDAKGVVVESVLRNITLTARTEQ